MIPEPGQVWGHVHDKSFAQVLAVYDRRHGTEVAMVSFKDGRRWTLMLPMFLLRYRLVAERMFPLPERKDELHKLMIKVFLAGYTKGVNRSAFDPDLALADYDLDAISYEVDQFIGSL